jgi:colicin import membrane protein
MALHLKAWMWMGGLLLAGGALAQEAGPVRSVEEADALLAQVAKGRAAAENEYAEREQVCYAKFFVNNCLDEAKEKRRARLVELRRIEIDANRFKRKDAVEHRDRELEDRAQRDATEEASRAANPRAPHANPDGKPRPQPLKKLPAQRQAEHVAREQQRAAQEAADAGKRARNVADYQRRQAESAERQQRVAEKKAEREAKRAQRAADDAAKKAAEAEKAKQKTPGQ